MAFVNYNKFKEEVLEGLTNKDKNLLFYWSLIDYSGWEEGDFNIDVDKGIQTVIDILKRSTHLKKIIEKNIDYFTRRFIQGELLSNYLLANELEKLLADDWKLDIKHLQRDDPGDVRFQHSGTYVTIEIKGQLSPANMKRRIEDEVVRYLDQDSYNNFLLLLLFPVCEDDNISRITQFVKGYYIYEEILRNHKGLFAKLKQYLARLTKSQWKVKHQKVLCQCFTIDENRNYIYSLENLSEHVKKYFCEII